jgi:hypothetical protein
MLTASSFFNLQRDADLIYLSIMLKGRFIDKMYLFVDHIGRRFACMNFMPASDSEYYYVGKIRSSDVTVTVGYPNSIATVEKVKKLILDKFL